jgi:hypothetical protein
MKGSCHSFARLAMALPAAAPPVAAGICSNFAPCPKRLRAGFRPPLPAGFGLNEASRFKPQQREPGTVPTDPALSLDRHRRPAHQRLTDQTSLSWVPACCNTFEVGQYRPRSRLTLLRLGSSASVVTSMNNVACGNGMSISSAKGYAPAVEIGFEADFHRPEMHAIGLGQRVICINVIR